MSDEERDGRIVRGVAKRCGIDQERVRPRMEDGILVVGVEGCTETHQRIASALMGFQLGESVPWRVVRDEPRGEDPNFYTLETLHKMIGTLGNAPDGQLDKMFATRCRHVPTDTPLEETLDFLRDMRDEIVFCAGASGFVLNLLSLMLAHYPEQPEAMEARRAKLPWGHG